MTTLTDAAVPASSDRSALATSAGRVRAAAPGALPTIEDRANASTRRCVAAQAQTLHDLYLEGFWLVAMLREGAAPTDAALLRERLRGLLVDVDDGARRLGVTARDLDDAGYAFCALLDETILRTAAPTLRDAWARQPLQLERFGDQLAGDGFFARLDEVMRRGTDGHAALQVFHTCLLLGFHGRHAGDGSGDTALAPLVRRVGDELSRAPGRPGPAAPNAEPPDRLSHPLRREWPLPLVLALLLLTAAAAFVALRVTLMHETERRLSASLEPLAVLASPLDAPLRQAAASAPR